MSLLKKQKVVLLKRNNQLANTLVNAVFNLRKSQVQPSVCVNLVKLDKSGNAEGGIDNQGYIDRCSVGVSIFISLRQIDSSALITMLCGH